MRLKTLIISFLLIFNSCTSGDDISITFKNIWVRNSVRITHKNNKNRKSKIKKTTTKNNKKAKSLQKSNEKTNKKEIPDKHHSQFKFY